MIKEVCLYCGYKGKFQVIRTEKKVVSKLPNGKKIDGLDFSLDAKCPVCGETFLIGPFLDKKKIDVVLSA